MSSQQRNGSGLSFKTLLIAGAASAVAAILIPLLWRPGTVFAAAMTPIIVALVTELLRRPVDTVGSVRVRRTARGTAILDPPDEPFDPLAPPSSAELEELPATRVSEPVVHRRRPLTARQWKLALATGLVAFAAAAAVVTASELVAGDSVSGGGARTTFFGGGSSSRETDTDRREDAGREEERDREASPEPTQTPTATPEPSVTPEPTPSPTPTATPAVTAEPPAAAPAEPTPAP